MPSKLTVHIDNNTVVEMRKLLDHFGFSNVSQSELTILWSRLIPEIVREHPAFITGSFRKLRSNPKEK